MDKPTTSKFKYFLSPENTYIIDFGDIVAEIKGAEIMSIVYNHIKASHTSSSNPRSLDQDTLQDLQ